VKLKDFQDRFQRAILDADEGILDHLTDGAREKKSTLLRVYRDAYTLRLIEVVGNDHEQLRRYLGREYFAALGAAYIAAHPSHHPNARWFARGLPEFLRAAQPYTARPELAELAEIERALNDAFDAEDAAVLRMTDLAAIPPGEWAGVSFVRHPSAHGFQAHTNAAALWKALKAGDDPPAATVLAEPVRILAWRNDMTSMFRELPPDEAMMWQLVGEGATFGQVCEMMAVFGGSDGAPMRAAGILRGWLDVGMLSQAVRVNA
jgi:hypothetical protein